MRINFLDHVAIRVSDMEQSAAWYENVLGLTRFGDPEHWGPAPYMLVSGESGIAIFPKREDDDLNYVAERMHIAFNVDNNSFETFKKSLNHKGIEFTEEDHYYFHSIYLNDPDGYKIELTTRVRAS